MIQVSSREFRSNQASLFAKADAGEQVVIRRRGKQAYMLTPVNDDDFVVTPELHSRIMETRQLHENGKLKSISSKAELNAWLESL